MIAPVHLVVLDGEVVDIRAKLAAESPTTVQAAPALRPHAVQVGLADPLKEFARHVYDFSLTQLWGPSEARNRPDLRYPREYREHVPRPGPGGGTCTRCGNLDEPSCFSYLTPREALQQLGTEWGRNLWPETWVDLLFRRLHRFAERAPVRPEVAHTFANSWIMPRFDFAVVSDCRFVNEVETIVGRNQTVWRIERNTNGVASAHASEQEQETAEMLSYAKTVIPNHGTLATLRTHVREALDVT
jgi:hypothetical protein